MNKQRLRKFGVSWISRLIKEINASDKNPKTIFCILFDVFKLALDGLPKFVATGLLFENFSQMINPWANETSILAYYKFDFISLQDGDGGQVGSSSRMTQTLSLL